MAVLTRVMRASMLETLAQDYVRTAYAKGLPNMVVLVRHALRNALLAVVTVIGFRIAFILSGTIVVETVFALPGIGRLFTDSVFRLDYQVVQSLVVVLAVLVVAVNLLTDLAYAFIDPRIRIEIAASAFLDATVMSTTTPAAASAHLFTDASKRSEWRQAWRRFRANRMAVGGLAAILLLTLLAVFAPVFAPYDPINEIFRGMRGGSPTPAHPFGYDHLGRDLLSRVIFGSRVALLVGLIATGIAVTIGVVAGAVAGYFGSGVDMLISRVIDTLMAFPIIALLVVLAAVLGPSLATTILVIGTTGWARFARVVRADVMSLKATDFVTAARAVGVRDWRIIWRHLLPNVMGPVIVLATLGIGGIIILESALSFLGLGIRPPNPSWGGTLADGRAFILRFPHIAFFPGLMIVITVLAFNFLGDGLRDALDPRERD